MGDPIPPVLDGLRLPARFVAAATLAANPDGSLRVVDQVRPWDDRAPPAGPFTAVICDGGVHHYFHFMEAIIWLVALHRCFLPGATLVRILFTMPWDNPQQNHVQRHVLATLFPGIPIADPGWPMPVTYPDVLIIDRDWRDTGINKFLEAGLGFAGPAVQAMGRAARAAVGAAARRAADLRILYVPRGPPRCLTPDAEAALIGLLAQHGSVTRCDFAVLPWAQQVRMAAAHDALVSVHGNGLTNALWMLPGSLVLELFPNFVRHYDYQLYAELADLAYFGFERDLVFPAFSRTGEPYGHQAPSNRPISAVPLTTIDRLLAWHAARR